MHQLYTMFMSNVAVKGANQKNIIMLQLSVTGNILTVYSEYAGTYDMTKEKQMLNIYN